MQGARAILLGMAESLRPKPQGVTPKCPACGQPLARNDVPVSRRFGDELEPVAPVLWCVTADCDRFHADVLGDE